MEEKLQALISWLHKQQQRRLDEGVSEVETPAQVCISFYEKRDKGGWFGRQKERLYWEQWRIPLEIFTGDDTTMAERRGGRVCRVDSFLIPNFAHLPRSHWIVSE